MSDRNRTSSEPDGTVPFKYIFGEKDNVVIVLFSGKMASTDSKVFDQCAAEVACKPQKIVLLSFSEIENAAIGVFSSFARFQKCLRDKGKILGLCGINAEMKAQFQASGIVRDRELFSNVPSAWQALKDKAAEEDQIADPEKKSA